MGEIRFGGVPCRVTRATCELYHLYFAEPDWSLEAETDGIFPRLAVSGRLAAPALPGPSQLGLIYIDDPRVVVLDGRRGSLAPREEPASHLRLVDLGDGRVRIDGTLRLVWRALGSAGAEADAAADAASAGAGGARDYTIEVALEAALVT